MSGHHAVDLNRGSRVQGSGLRWPFAFGEARNLTPGTDVNRVAPSLPSARHATRTGGPLGARCPRLATTMPCRPLNVLRLAGAIWLGAAGACLAAVESRFPRPDFASDYVSPTLVVPSAPSALWPWIDVGVLLVALALASYLALVRRSRLGLLGLTIFSLFYFGFWRYGCVCPVGSVQNVAVGLFGSGYRIPASVVLLFLLPLVFALFWGRVFCAAVCPLGAVQELVVLRPVALPLWLNRLLGLGRYLVLALGGFLAAGGVGFLICRHDPFVPLFRLGGPWPMVAAGGLLLLLGTIVGRPYCRFVCPYGVLLEWAARLAWRRTTITPANCVVCRLCESACPYDAIEKPEHEPKEGRLAGRAAWRLVAALALLPLLAAVGGWAGGRLGPRLGAAHPTLQVANAILADQKPREWLATTRVEAFAESGAPLEPFVAEARETHLRLVALGRGFGLFLGAAIGLQLVALARRVVHDDYRPDPAACLSCGRCFRYCPVPAPPAGGRRPEVRGQRSVVSSQ